MIQVIAQEVKTVYLEAHCESCGEEISRYGKGRMLEGRVVFPHPCEKCQVIYMIGETFPKRYSGEWEEVERINLMLRSVVKMDMDGNPLGVDGGHVVDCHGKQEEQLEICMS